MFGKYHFTVDDIPDLSGQVALVTGGSTGIGKEVAQELARRGCHVILTSRTQDRGEAAVNSIISLTNNKRVEWMSLDLASFKSVSKFVKQFRQKQLPLNILVNNAGMINANFSVTENGFEEQFQVNYLSHFILTMELLDIIEKSTPARIVNLTSIAHKMTPHGGIDFDDMVDAKKFGSWRAYGRSKLAMILFTKSLTRKLEGKNIFVNAVHPGYVDTDMAVSFNNSYPILRPLLSAMASVLAVSRPKGALSTLYCATSPKVVNLQQKGYYIIPYGQVATPSKLSLDENLQQKLWDFSEKARNDYKSSA